MQCFECSNMARGVCASCGAGLCADHGTLANVSREILTGNMNQTKEVETRSFLCAVDAAAYGIDD